MTDIHRIAFPGLGIEEFTLNKVAFSLFGRDIMWYGVIITCGIILASLYALYRARKNEGIKTDDVLDYAIYLVIFGVIGARLYYVATKFDTFKTDSFFETLYNILAVWEGGLAIYGGIIAGAAAVIVVSLLKKIHVLRAFDMVAPAVMIGQILGRWGNFFNGEAYGWSKKVDSLPWRMYLEGAYRTEFVNGVETRIPVDYVHPTFLYESLWNLLGFLLIHLLYNRKKFNGQILLMYLSWYGFGRMLIEGLRTDSLYVGDFRISQLVGFACFFFGAATLIAMLIVTHLREKDAVRIAAATASLTAEALPADKTSLIAERETDEEPPATDENVAASADEPSPPIAPEFFDISAAYTNDDDEEENT